MLDHIGITVKDYEKSKKFYQLSLAPLGYKLVADDEGCVGFGLDGNANFWIHNGAKKTSPIHIAFRGKSREEVDEFYKAAIKAGGMDNGPPGTWRKAYHPEYYRALIFDLDGNNIEVLCHDV